MRRLFHSSKPFFRLFSRGRFRLRFEAEIRAFPHAYGAERQESREGVYTRLPMGIPSYTVRQIDDRSKKPSKIVSAALGGSREIVEKKISIIWWGRMSGGNYAACECGARNFCERRVSGRAYVPLNDLIVSSFRLAAVSGIEFLCKRWAAVFFTALGKSGGSFEPLKLGDGRRHGDGPPARDSSFRVRSCRSVFAFSR